MSLRRYDSYKPCGVDWLGSVPAHWTLTKVRWLFKIPKRIAGELGFDVFSVTQHGFRVKDLDSNEGQLSQDYSKYQLVEVGDFAMNHMDLITGGVDIARTRGVTSPDYRVVSILDTGRCYDRYFLYAFQKCFRERIFYAYGQGSSQLGRWRLPTDNFRDFSLPVPPRAEQEAISSFLDREVASIEALIAEQQLLIDLLTEKRHAVISHAVTKGLNLDAPMKPSGVDWLGDVPAHWLSARVRSVSSFMTSGPRGWSERVGDEGSLFIQSGDLDDALRVMFDGVKRVRVESDAEASRTRIAEGDVLVCITGAKTGNVAVCQSLPEAAYVNQHLCLIRPSQSVVPMFLGMLLKSRAGQTHFELSQYGLKQGLSLEDVKDAPVFLPPLPEQMAITDYLTRATLKMDHLSTEAHAVVDLLRERRAALVSAAVTGQIDVRGYAPTPTTNA